MSAAKIDGVVALFGVPTTDGRLIESGALTWHLPIPVMLMGHEPVGVLDEIEEVDGVLVVHGWVDDDATFGPHAVPVIHLDAVRFESSHDGRESIVGARLRALSLCTGDARAAWQGLSVRKVARA